MKKVFKNSLLILALLGVLFTSCRKDPEDPPVEPLPVGTVFTIDSILKMTPGKTFTDDASVYGIVTADEVSGNLYKAAFIQDRATGKAIELYLNSTSGVRIGDSIRVYLKDVKYDMYNGLPQLSGFDPDGHIVILDNKKDIQPAEVTLDDILHADPADKYKGALVKVNNIKFTALDQTTKFAESNTYGNRTVIDVDHTENYATVRTSNYANFAENTLPQGTGSMVCIASYYETSSSVTWQFLIRSISELTFDGYYTALPYFQEFGTDFGSYTTYSVAGDQVWEIAYRTAKMTGNVNNVNHANEDWLLSSPVAVTGMEHAKVRVNYAAQYQNSNTEDVTLQISKDYVAGMDPLDPSVHWTQLNVTLPNTSGWDDFQTIEASLDEFIGQTVTVAIKFLSSESQSRTMEIKYISVEEGVASSGGGGGTGGEVQSLPYVQLFETGFGTYMPYDVMGDQSWAIEYKSANMTGYVSGTNNANEDWLISSPVDLSGVSDAKMTMSYIGRYFTNINNDVTVWASTDYTYGNDPTTATWTQVPSTLSEGNNWTDFLTAEVALTDYVGQTVTLAVKYLSTDVKAGTMEIKSITIEEGSAGGGGGGGGTGGEVQNLPYTQSFTSEFGSYITKDVMGAQSWVIDFRTAKMTGYVSGTNNANEDWLISSPVAITGVSDAKMTITYIARYFSSINSDITIWASTNYTWDSDPSTATWTQVPSTLSEGNNWNDFLTTEISLSDYVGQTVTLAVKYLSTDVKAGTIEIQSITIEEGSTGGGGGGGGGGTTGGEVQNLPYAQSFTSDFGSYVTKDVMGAQSWVIDFNTAKMTGYVSGTNNANEDWLISSPVAITGVSDAKMTITYIARYFSSINSDITIWASTNYTWDSDPSTATWTQVPSTLSEGNNWNDFLTAEISLTDYVGQTVTLAVKYLSTDIKAGTLEIQSITIQEGTGITPTPPPTPGNPEGSGTAEDPYNVAAGIVNQGQENVWVHGYIVGAVKSGNSTVNSNDQVNWAAPFDLATNVLIADDPNCNEVALCVIVNLPSNKPLRTQVNLMDHPENLGKMLAVNGKLRTYFGQAGLRDSGGTESDFVLEGGSPTPPPTPPTGIFSETFASGQGAFVIQDVVMPSELSYVWAHNSQYSCMKASAYVGQNYETESWLISPSIDLTGVSTASLSFEQAVNYASPTGSLFVMISTNYMDNVTTATWETLAISSWPAGNNWTFINSTADLTSYVGQTVTIAFKYTSTSSSSATWEVKNFVVE